MRSPVPPADAFPVHCDVEVRFRDLDAMGHVNNAVYLHYFEIGRTDYMVALGARRDQPVTEIYPFILAEVGVRFLSAATLADRLTVHARAIRLGGKSFDLEFLVTVGDGRAVALGHSVQVWYDYSGRRTVPIPEAFRRAVERLEGRIPA